MRSRKITTTQNRKPTIRREREPLSWKYILLTSFCGLILVVGFFGAARQHFASINYGIENSKLKKQIEELKSDQGRIKLAREIALSPAEIKKSAKKLGFVEMTASNIQSFHAETVSGEKANVNKASINKASELKVAASNKSEVEKNKSKKKDKKEKSIENKIQIAKK